MHRTPWFHGGALLAQSGESIDTPPWWPPREPRHPDTVVGGAGHASGHSDAKRQPRRLRPRPPRLASHLEETETHEITHLGRNAGRLLAAAPAAFGPGLQGTIRMLAPGARADGESSGAAQARHREPDGRAHGLAGLPVLPGPSGEQSRPHPRRS